MITAAVGTAALTSLRSLYDIAKDIRNSNDPDKLRVAAGQMFDLAIAAREQVAALQRERDEAVNELAALMAEVEKAKAFDAEKENYIRELTRTGTVVYREKDSAGPQGKSPYFCPNCFGDRKIAIMNPAKGANSRMAYVSFSCPKCSMTTEMEGLR
jgi:hypothetical protein